MREQPSSSAQKRRQLEFYYHHDEPEMEIERPRSYPRPVRFLLDFKLRTLLDLLGPAPARAWALVVCCGSGMDAEFLARAGFRVIGVDISAAALGRARERARRYGVRYELVVGDAERLPLRDGAVEFGAVHDGLHHLPRPDRALEELMRVSRRAVMLAEPAQAGLTRLAVWLGIAGDVEDAGNDVYRFRARDLATALAARGFTRIRWRRDLIYYQPWSFALYRLFEGRTGFSLFRIGFHACNRLIGRWGNSLRLVACRGLHEGVG